VPSCAQPKGNGGDTEALVWSKPQALAASAARDQVRVSERDRAAEFASRASLEGKNEQPQARNGTPVQLQHGETKQGTGETAVSASHFLSVFTRSAPTSSSRNGTEAGPGGPVSFRRPFV